MYAKANMGILGAQVEGDLGGKSAIRLQSELSTDAVSAAVGLKVALETAPKGSILTTGQLPLGLRSKNFGAGFSVVTEGARGPDGK